MQINQTSYHLPTVAEIAANNSRHIQQYTFIHYIQHAKQIEIKFLVKTARFQNPILYSKCQTKHKIQFTCK